MFSNISAEMQIFLPVVRLDQVDMVDALGFSDRSTQSALHNLDMLPPGPLALALATDPLDAISAVVGPFSARGDPDTPGPFADGDWMPSKAAGQFSQARLAGKFLQQRILLSSPWALVEGEQSEPCAAVLGASERHAKASSKL